MREVQLRQEKRIKGMTSIKDLQNLPLFKADKQRIYDEALSLAKSQAATKQYGKLVDPQVIEFRVHYVTSVRDKKIYCKI